MSDIAASGLTNTGKNYSSFGYRSYVLLTLTIVYTLNFIDRILISVVSRPIIEEFALTNFQFGLLTGIGFALFYTLLGIPIASYSERASRKTIIGVCVILWSVATALCGLTTGFITLLAARLLVGIGEAGCTPPANSMISDYYTPRARATALGIYAMGVTFGTVLAQLFGGKILQLFSWREAFIYLGLPGVIVGLLVLLTVKEPPRGYSDPPGTVKPEKASFKEAMREISSKSTFWTMTIGATLAAFAGYSLVSFLPLFIQYNHGLGAGETAISYMAPIALASTLGAFLGGFLTEQASKRSETAASWVPGIAFLLAVPFYLWGFYAGGLGAMLIALAIGGCLHYFYLGAQYNIAQSVVSVRSRATAIAILLFVVNLIGYGLGPAFTGFLADMFTTSGISQTAFATDLSVSICNDKAALAAMSAPMADACNGAKASAMQLTCAIISVVYLLAGIFFLLSARTLKRDLVTRLNT